MASSLIGDKIGATKTKRGTIYKNSVGDVYCHGTFIDISGIYCFQSGKRGDGG